MSSTVEKGFEQSLFESQVIFIFTAYQDAVDLRAKKDIILNIIGHPNIMLSVKFNAK